jgi:hypothetical protein
MIKKYPTGQGMIYRRYSLLIFFEQKLNYICFNPLIGENVNKPDEYRYSSVIAWADCKG